jgi:hypothetical protein
MKNITRIIRLTLFLSLIVLNLHGFGLAGNTASVTVSATVLPRVTQSIIHQEKGIRITEEDIRRGIVEIPFGTILNVKTNTRSGYGLIFEGGSIDLFKEVQVRSQGKTVTLSENGGLVHQPGSSGAMGVIDISYIFHLREGVQPGAYPWPFRVMASLY